MDDLLNEFLTETNESLDTVDVELVRFEKDPTDRAVLDNIFRLVHTVKGTCGFLNLPRLESVAHASENVLGKFRDGELQVSTVAVNLILKSIDAIKMILAELESSGSEPNGTDKELIDRLNEVASGAIVAPLPVENLPAAKPRLPGAAATEKITASFADGELKIVPALRRKLMPGEVSLEELEAAFNAAPGPDDSDDKVKTVQQPKAAPGAKPAGSDKSSPKGTASAARASESDEAPAAKLLSSRASETSVANQSVRVTVDLLENLMTMVSELVLTRNQLMQIVREQDDTKFKVPLQRLNLVTTELQEGVMKTRMQPVGNAWQKLPRIIRDLSHELGKKIELQMAGADTELDRQVLELIKDPLTHMIRNSADHGLELPKARLAAGKSATGVIKLRAFHEGGHVIITISDDGAGLDIERIKAKAISSGLVGEAEAGEMTDQQIGSFIFKPGLSTAEEVTSVSGRGVGMDVVRSNIEKIGGTVDVRSTRGKGSVFTIKIPLTLAIVSALIIELQGERFAIPQISVIELVRTSQSSEHRIERINNTPVLRLREQLVPLVFLGDVLGMNGADSAQPAAPSRKEDFVVVTQVGNFRFGIVVDRVLDTEEIVVKPIARMLRHITVFSGNTILGDGRVIMILDPNGIATLCGNVKIDQDEAGTEVAAPADAEKKVSLLIFRAGSETPKAVPLSLIARLEEIDCSSIEKSNGRNVVQYRGQLMPLVGVSENCDFRTHGRQPLLVFADETRTMGLAVDEIVDIVEDVMKVELSGDAPGIIGTAIINGAATEIIDVSHYLVLGFPDWFEESRKARIKTARKILLIDDSPFFRNLLGPALKTAGYTVTSVENAEQALALREEGARFDAIVSDIEMPGISGFELATIIKSDDRWAGTPIVAISAHGTREDFERGRKVGFADYVVKMDRGALLRSLSETLSAYGDAA